ncbi:flagellar protein FliO/FliZ [Cupriavidus sp. OV038]|jgi:flagellar protein FliO/FliZ|uniref:flagellar biosynthetic protein FliO n=1 Tax=unclassified Cupriavidus TaxID=2640874 RepID=UPI0008F3D4A7|nr:MULTISPECIES: flagellar biosynthetic protein FliO [unclassified Cupriavidus]SFC57939.1 flagellar protein FliO/FliZ [Cupriavidus sp. OV038]SFP44882.1 flagellar protein FliO/FliZ [Cupriavidus sp. OV096]
MTAVSRRLRSAGRFAAGLILTGLATAGAQAADVVLSTAQAASAPAAPVAQSAPVISGGASLAQAGLGLFAVIALILGMAWLARRVGLVRHGSGGATMKVVGSLMLGARQKVVMVEVGDTWLVLGVSAGEIRPLHTLPAQPDAMVPAGTTAPQPLQGGFGERLMRAMQENLKK